MKIPQGSGSLVCDGLGARKSNGSGSLVQTWTGLPIEHVAHRSLVQTWTRLLQSHMLYELPSCRAALTKVALHWGSVPVKALLPNQVVVPLRARTSNAGPLRLRQLCIKQHVTEWRQPCQNFLMKGVDSRKGCKKLQ